MESLGGREGPDGPGAAFRAPENVQEQRQSPGTFDLNVFGLVAVCRWRLVLTVALPPVWAQRVGTHRKQEDWFQTIANLGQAGLVFVCGVPVLCWLRLKHQPQTHPLPGHDSGPRARARVLLAHFVCLKCVFPLPWRG